MHFFDISTSESGPNLVCIIHFDLEMCFTPQRRALFRHLNFQKRSEPGVLCTFWLGNVLRATTAYTFSTSQLPKAVRSWCVLYILTWKCASRHNGVHLFDISTSNQWSEREVFLAFFTYKCGSRHHGVQFFISHLASWLRTHRSSEVTFPPSGAPNQWKKPQWIATFLPFRAPASSCFPLFLFSDLLTSWLLLSDSFHLCFSISAYCRKFDF